MKINKFILQSCEREQLGSVARQTTFFITLKVVVVGVGVGGCGAAAPSCVQVAFSPG